MWQEYRTSENKLCFKVDYEHGLIQCIKNGSVITINYLTKEVVEKRKAGQKKTA